VGQILRDLPQLAAQPERLTGKKLGFIGVT
jgi:hypothetical protein